MWGPSVRESNIWIAEAKQVNKKPALQSLKPVQALFGTGNPFEKLIQTLRRRDYAAAAIDAPFSIPLEFVPKGGHKKLLEMVNKLDRKRGDPFPTGKEFVCAVLDGRIPEKKKPLRVTERIWQQRNISTRSTLWSGVRPGAPMTVACLTLLHESECPIWPWNRPTVPGLLVEAFPAAQLNWWHMPHLNYNGPDFQETRKRMADCLEDWITLGDFRAVVEKSADALDAVVCIFAAIAATSGEHPELPEDRPMEEGWIAVHKWRTSALRYNWE